MNLTTPLRLKSIKPFRLQRVSKKYTDIHSKNMTLVAQSARCDAHMNELPVPCQPWEPWYTDRHSFYNKVLVFGALWFLFSFGVMLYTDSFYLNWGPPAQPGPPSDMVEECDDLDT